MKGCFSRSSRRDMRPVKIVLTVVPTGFAACVLILNLFASSPTHGDDSNRSQETSPIPQTHDLPPLSKARELGRSRSALLTSVSIKKTPLPNASPQADLAKFKNQVLPVFAKTCVGCHGPNKAKGKFRIDTLDPDLLHGGDVNRWLEVFDALSNGEMPPEDAKVELADADLSNIIDWLSGEIQKASKVRRNEGSHSSFRRMARYEYNYALQDLLGLPHSFDDRLPPETASEDGFKNSSEMLQMSAMQFETYREIGLEALKRAAVSGERPEAITYVISMQEEMSKVATKKTKFFDKTDKNYNSNRNRQHLFNRETGKGRHFSGGTWTPNSEAVAEVARSVSPVVLVLPRSNEFKMNLGRFLPDEGIMRVRIHAGRTTMKPDEYASLRLVFGAHTSNNASFSQVISKRDIPVTAPAEKPQWIQFEIPLSQIPRNPFRKLETTFPRRDERLSILNISNEHDKNEPLHVLIDSIEIIAPYYDQWPPSTHNAIFVGSKNSSNEKEFGREVLTRFMSRAWRRPVTPQEVDQFMVLFDKYRPGFSSFEDAMLEVLSTVLAAPDFLYLTQRASAGVSKKLSTISDIELASRLSFFLWSSIPDDELVKLAEQGKLNVPRTLANQVKRMLADPRADRFAQHFVQQWLALDGLDSVTHVTDSELKDAMQTEPVAFFNEVLKGNSSVMDFIHSDYAVVNERLANHYRIPGVYGPHFRKVPIKPEVNRGGILTNAAILTMNSDGIDSHPLKRGIWLLEHILHDPPPPPPPNVPEVDLTDPKILKMTLKERIVDHRNKPACLSCHAKIDPWGIAFENYDAMGLFRTKINNKPVDATSALFNKHELAGIDGLKQYLLTDRQDQFAKAMVHKMTAYALGRPLTFSDRAEVDSLTVQFRKSGDRLGDLVNLIIKSDLFRAKGN